MMCSVATVAQAYVKYAVFKLWACYQMAAMDRESQWAAARTSGRRQGKVASEAVKEDVELNRMRKGDDKSQRAVLNGADGLPSTCFTLESRARAGCQAHAIASMAATHSQRTAESKPNGKPGSQSSSHCGWCFSFVYMSPSTGTIYCSSCLGFRFVFVLQPRAVRDLLQVGARTSNRNADTAGVYELNCYMISSRAIARQVRPVSLPLFPVTCCPCTQTWISVSDVRCNLLLR
jgi:hypothetical protein